jgi:hypothetical protein
MSRFCAEAVLTIENAICFQQPHWAVIASGCAPEPWFRRKACVCNGGISNPKRIALKIGHKYYRFINKNAPLWKQIGSGWWIDSENFSIIQSHSNKNENRCTLMEAAHLFLALPYEFSPADCLVSAILDIRLDAYVGSGNVAFGRPMQSASKWTPLRHPRLVQLYIPGLYSLRRDGTRLYRRAFPYPEFKFNIAN